MVVWRKIFLVLLEVALIVLAVLYLEYYLFSRDYIPLDEYQCQKSDILCTNVDVISVIEQDKPILYLSDDKPYMLIGVINGTDIPAVIYTLNPPKISANEVVYVEGKGEISPYSVFFGIVIKIKNAKIQNVSAT